MPFPHVVLSSSTRGRFISISTQVLSSRINFIKWQMPIKAMSAFELLVPATFRSIFQHQFLSAFYRTWDGINCTLNVPTSLWVNCSAANTCFVHDYIRSDESCLRCFPCQLESLTKAACRDGGGGRLNGGNALNTGWPIGSQRQDCCPKFCVPEGYLCLIHNAHPQDDSLQCWLAITPWKSVSNWAVPNDKTLCRHCPQHASWLHTKFPHFTNHVKIQY